MIKSAWMGTIRLKYNKGEEGNGKNIHMLEITNYNLPVAGDELLIFFLNC